MPAKKQSAANLKAIRWDQDDWTMLATIAKRVGVSRSAFVKRAAMREAGLVLAGAAPHYAGGPTVAPHNGGAKTFSNAKQATKRVTEERGAVSPLPAAPAKASRRPADERAKPKPKAG